MPCFAFCYINMNMKSLVDLCDWKLTTKPGIEAHIAEKGGSEGDGTST